MDSSSKPHSKQPSPDQLIPTSTPTPPQHQFEEEPLADVIRAVAPGIAWSSAKVGLGCGTLGLLTGPPLALLTRSLTPTLFTLATSLQWTILGTSYHLFRSSSLVYLARSSGVDAWSLSDRQKERASGIGGMAAGAFGGALRGRVGNVLAGMVVLGGLGWAGQRGWNVRYGGGVGGEQGAGVGVGAGVGAGQAEERTMGVVERMAKSRFNPMRRLSDEEYEGMLREKLIRIEAELQFVDEDIARLEVERGTAKD